MIAADYPLLDVFWTMLIFFVWVAWFMLLFRVIGDVFRRHDVGGGVKVLWLIFVIAVPFLGVFIYLIARGRSMSERHLAEQAQAQAETSDYIRSVAKTSSPADEITKAQQLLSSGAISQAEFDALKAKSLA